MSIHFSNFVAGNAELFSKMRNVFELITGNTETKESVQSLNLSANEFFCYKEVISQKT